ncbi:MAG: DUF1249 domain-containing protein [Pseudomonadota bacterium]
MLEKAVLVQMKATDHQGRIAKNILARPLPNSFAGLMEMYEGNYIRLRKMLGKKVSMPEVAVSRIAKGMDLYLQVLEQTKYTSTIALTYYFADTDQGFLAYPNLKIRIYYDALQAEVMSQSYRRKNKLNDPNFHAFNHQLDATLLKRWRMNRFLYKWLHFCDRQGHSFILHQKARQNRLITKNVEIPLQQGSTSSTIIE